MDNITLYRINSLLEHVDLVLNDTNGKSIEDFKENSILLRATCFSIAQIGEMLNQLEKALSLKYQNLPWTDSRRMRNIIIHDYGKTDIEQVYSTIRNDLPNLKVAFITIKNDLISDERSTKEN